MTRIYRLLSVVIAVIVPFFLIMSAVRVLISPLFLQIEYRSPAFPPDVYGFSQADRLYWSRFAVDYLVNHAGIEYLGDLRFPNGLPLYNERELDHMVDVKNLVQAMIRVWRLLLALLLALGGWAWLGKWSGSYWRGISNGGWATIAAISLILISVVISFNSLFTNFHRIFFTGDSWMFAWSDTLIRLFPLRFWRDAFIMMGMFTISGALICIFAGRWLAQKASQRS